MIVGFDMQALIGGGGTGLGAYARGLLWGMERLVSGKVDAGEFISDLPDRLRERVSSVSDWPRCIEIVRLYPNRLEEPLSTAAMRVRWEQVHLPRAARAENASVIATPALGTPVSGSIPRVAVVHDLIPLHRIRFPVGLSDLYFTRYLPFCWRRADYLVFDTNTVREEFLARFTGVKRDKTFVVPAFPACRVPGLYPPTSGGHWDEEANFELLKGEPAAYEDRRGFISVATFEARKNLGLVLEAYARLSESIREKHPLVLIGKGAGERDYFLRMVEEDGLSRHVRLTGYVESEKLVEWYRGALALVFPSTDEGFGIPPIEAMSFGTPAIIGDAPALLEVYGGVCPSVERDDARGLAEKMRRLAEDFDYWRGLSDEGIEFSKQFSPERTAAVMLAVLFLAGGGDGE